MADLVGFLSVRYRSEHGFFGGYLIVNQLARPLEFHCTMPVRPSRSQELLYGKTLNDFVCGEQIAKALTQKAKLKPTFVLTDTPAALSVEIVNDKIPIAHLATDESSQGDLSNPETATPLKSLRVDALHLQARENSRLDEEKATELVSRLGERFDFHEPFQRVIDALLEAHPNVRAA